MQWDLLLLIWIGNCCLIVCQLYEYHYINEEKTWTEAQQYCRENHTDLATVSNMADMKRLLSHSAGNMKEAWIGLYDQADATRIWHWSLPGVEFNESNQPWRENQPNDYGGLQNCGIIWKNLKWGDISCSKKQEFLCFDDNNSTKKFHLIQDKKNWTVAQSYCREKHTDLASGLTQLQDEELRKELSPLNNETYSLTGLFRDTWRWSDGSSFSFRHWNLQFDSEQHNSGQCAMTVFDDGGRWKNENCTETKPFICYAPSSFILIKENKTWEDALKYCRDHYHDLVTITSLDKQRWIQQEAKFASTDYVWMGLHYACTLDLWFWISDEVVSCQNWALGEPVDDCDMSGAMETRGEHKWRKINDSEKFNFICSKNRQ
ncbi:C-type mannose receptor 2-like [Cyprinodon tularosa]|uniref:C-type mannose receptor 2-like n=1 Tax=Cyprinodon tularosa TaxID=77115 RepID=UPI0018E1E75D|nr:C-type mannose receptor 2-like [Cyprinodon tularosa]